MHPFDGRVVSNFIRQAILGQDITIFGTGQQTRAFCYVDDLVEGIIRMMNGPDSFVGPVNLGNPGEFTIKQLAETGHPAHRQQVQDRQQARARG
jgi:UDP-glucuronate decarboxylase